MSRPLRIQYPGAWYHVTCRGNERAPIYQDDKDKERFLTTLEESVEAFHVEVHCYTLMSNHFHLLLKTPEANLGRFMQRFNTAYTTYYNLRHDRSGHLYQGRYKSILVEADEYLLELSRYIHLNPVRVYTRQGSSVEEKAQTLKGYKWSSLPGYISLKRRNDFTHYGEVLGYMGGDNRKGRALYRGFVVKGLNGEVENPLGEVKANAILGTERFIGWVKEQFIDVREWPSKDYPYMKALQKTIPVEEIAEVVARDYGVEPQDIVKARSPWREARQMLIETSYRLHVRKKSLHELGQDLGGITGDAVAHAHERIRKRIVKDRQLSERIDKLYRTISQ